jgi:hypothetical protein
MKHLTRALTHSALSALGLLVPGLSRLGRSLLGLSLLGLSLLGLSLLGLSLLGCSPAHEIITDCRDTDGVHVICGFQNPEDLALLPDGHTVVVSQFGSMDGARPGNLALFDLSDESLRIAFRGHDAGGVAAAPERTTGWGDANCPSAPTAEFAPHGLDLATRPDGRLQLLVVNHGGRESIEFFEIEGSDDETKITWRGCAIPPDGAYLNDVVALADGGFLVTHMMGRESQITDVLLAAFGVDSGFVYAWQPGMGFAVEPGTGGRFPNGIEVSDDGTEIFLNLYLGNEVRRISRETGEILAVAPVRQPDNATWATDGRLLVASHLASLVDSLACNDLVAGACPFEFEIVALDPKTLEREVLVRRAGAPMGAATVALDTDGELVMGSFAGDRVMRVPLDGDE